MTLQEALEKIAMRDKAHTVLKHEDLKGYLFAVPPIGEVVELDLDNIAQTEGGKSTYCLASWGGNQHLFKLNWLWNYLPKVCNGGQRIGAFGVVAEDLRATGTVSGAVIHLATKPKVRRIGAKQGFSYSFNNDTKKVDYDINKRVPVEVYGWEWA